MTITLRAVAAAAGVHVATASRALNAGTQHMVSEPVRLRVLEAAARLDYRPDVSAAALRSGRSRLVGILVPGLSNPVYAPIIAGAAEVLNGAAIGTMVGDTGTLRERSVGLVRELVARRVDGLLVATSLQDSDDGVDHALRGGVPMVLLNRSMHDVVTVEPDSQASIGLAVDHLVSLGHRQIGYLGGVIASVWRSPRLEAFLTAMRRHGLQPTAPPFEVPGFGRDAGRQGARALLAAAPGMTGLVCGNDMLAVGTFDAARELGLQLPHDLSVIGHNDLPFMDALSPPLSTIRVDYHRLGEVAADLLLRRIAGKPAESALMPPTLIVRGSTAPPRARPPARLPPRPPGLIRANGSLRKSP